MTEFIDPHDGTDVRPHPAKFSDAIIDKIREIMPEDVKYIIDPMAGVGKVTNIGLEYQYVLNELEPEWANQIDAKYPVRIGDAADMYIPSSKSYAVVTSPPYGNRMADFFVSKTRPESMKGRYAGDLGRKLTEGSTASKKFGNEYCDMMENIYTNIANQMEKGQHFILNVSNFIREYNEVNVTGFYLDLFTRLGFTLDRLEPIKTPRSRGHGANANLRVDHEVIMLWRKVVDK